MKYFKCLECGKVKSFTELQYKKLEVVMCEACLEEMEEIK